MIFRKSPGPGFAFPLSLKTNDIVRSVGSAPAERIRDRGAGRKSTRLDAMELLRYPGAVGYRRVIGNPQPGAAHAIG